MYCIQVPNDQNTLIVQSALGSNLSVACNQGRIQDFCNGVSISKSFYRNIALISC